MNKENQNTSPDERISVIEINGTWFGVNILKSREVIPLPSVTPVPNTREFMIGVFNLRGDIFALIDICTILGMESKKIHNTDMVVLLDNGQMAMGILADRIHGVRSLNDVKIKPAHGIVSKTMEEFVTGVMSEKSSMIYILDIERLFSSPAIRTYF